MNCEYYISIGSNLGNRAEFLRSAARAMEASHIHIAAYSAIYETKPWGRREQPSFLNAVVCACWEGTPEDLMRQLLEIEQTHQRKRVIHWGPRTLDLDLIYSEGVVRNTPFLHLPHPLFWERDFVLIPMADIVPEFVYHGESIKSRIDALHGWDNVQRTKEEWENKSYAGK